VIASTTPVGFATHSGFATQRVKIACRNAVSKGLTATIRRFATQTYEKRVIRCKATPVTLVK
jgi:hypothetical protein